MLAEVAVSAQPLEIRMARLEGAYEQLDRRLADLRDDMDQRFSDLREYLDQRFGAIDGRFAVIDQRFGANDQRFMWLAAMVVSTWITTILTALFHR